MNFDRRVRRQVIVVNHEGKGKTVKFNVRAEVWKFMNNRKTKADAQDILYWIGNDWLELEKAEAAEADEQKDVAELERMMRLEDPRK
jgi:hypothetical protein